MILDDYDKQILQSATFPLKSSEISELTGLSKPIVLQHLKKLIELELIKKTGYWARPSTIQLNEVQEAEIKKIAIMNFGAYSSFGALF
jgi:DNA-binding Lrp family transcriptional regulator